MIVGHDVISTCGSLQNHQVIRGSFRFGEGTDRKSVRQRLDDLHSKQKYNFGFEAFPTISQGVLSHTSCLLQYCRVFFVGASCTFSALSSYQPVTLAQPVCCVQPISSISNLIWEAAVSYEFRACFVWVKQIEWY